jgi:predicted aldo/keto reductase-like oxidoreductase
MVRRAPSQVWLNEHWQAEMEKIDDCIDCGLCMTRRPYGLEIPKLLRKNLADYRGILDGSVKL